MRVVTYARVSTINQETEGQSLSNQELAFQKWISKERATGIRAYAGSKSAKSIEERSEFSRMISELPILRPDLVIVDTIDRIFHGT
jgi:DNA invertase Pin-like site-specific DNA recombinase